MTDGHVVFEKMSALFDNDISTEEERCLILDHIEICPVCSAEYEKLKKMEGLLSMLAGQEYVLTGLSSRTLSGYRSRKRRMMFNRYIPAVAASCLIIVGAGLTTSYFFNDASTGTIVNLADTTVHEGSAEQIVDIIRKYDASILKVSDMYVEGETTLENFNRLRRNLGFRKVGYNLTIHSASDISKSRSSTKAMGNIETVSMGNINQREIIKRGKDSALKKYVRFRVYR